MTSEFLRLMNVIPGGRRHIVRMGPRYLVYLPQNLNNVWEYLHEQKQRVNIYIVVDKKGDEDE